VKRGDSLVEIDPRDYQVAVESARANLAEAQAGLQSSRQDYAVAQANITQAVATNDKAQRDVVRYSKLIAANVISRDEYEEEVRIGRVDAAAVNSARANAGAAQKVIAQREAAVGAAQAALDQAELNLSYTHIHAPVSGVVGEKTVQVGERVQPGQEMLAIVPLNNIWVTANFKETELHQMRAGQKATIHVDALGRDYKGYVEGIAGASGELYSVLPPENATGNYVKVVQRFPVRIRFDPDQDPDHRLRPGMSVEPKVWLR
jgi:membrane fusion protein, multidrug efflux system